MQQVFPGLYVITRAGCNCYLIESAPDELTLIDTGMPGTSSAILKAAAQLNYQPEQIKQVLVTHTDLDHTGSLAAIVKKTGAIIYTGKASKPYAESGKMPPHVPGFMSAIMGAIQRKVTVDEVFDDNDLLPIAGGMRVLHVPGHTPENYVFFWEKHRVLFAADLFFALGSRVTLSPSAITWNQTKLKKSARRALALAPAYICAGHGTPVNLSKTPEKIASLQILLDGGVTLAAT